MRNDEERGRFAFIVHHSSFIWLAVFLRSCVDVLDRPPGPCLPFPGTARCPRRQESNEFPFPVSGDRKLGEFGNQECNCRYPSGMERSPCDKEWVDSPAGRAVARIKARQRA